MSFYTKIKPQFLLQNANIPTINSLNNTLAASISDIEKPKRASFAFKTYIYKHQHYTIILYKYCKILYKLDM